MRQLQRDQLTSAVRHRLGDPVAFLRQQAIFGDLVNRADLVAPNVAALGSLHEGALA